MNFLVWNLRGLNSQRKWDAIRNKIYEWSASIVCLQETKRESFDSGYIKKFCPRGLDKFEFSASVGASGGLVVVWNLVRYDGTLVYSNSYFITM